MRTSGVMGDQRRSRHRAAASLAIVPTLVLAGCATASRNAPATHPASSGTTVHGTAASCAALTRSQQLATAKLVFDGQVLPGAQAPHTNGILASPARVRVDHYLKGSGPASVTVQTAIKVVSSTAEQVSEDGIQPRAGEHWRIYTSTASQPYATSICLGSRRLPIRTNHFSSPGAISFDYPAWHARRYAMPAAPFSSWIVWLSPQRMHRPCVTRHGKYNTTITCTDPISHLRPASILADWTSNTNPAGRFRLRGGIPITVAGRRGTWVVQTGHTQAPQLGQTETITVVVPTPRTSNAWYQLTAFLRRPDSARLEAQIKTMLRSVHWPPPAASP